MMRALVSIHAPLTGGDVPASPSPADSMFQSTPPSREATGSLDMGVGRYRRFNPRPLTGGDIWTHLPTAQVIVSIHAPLTGGDSRSSVVHRARTRFNPRPPHGRRRFERRTSVGGAGVSIHAPLTGGDHPGSPERPVCCRFQSTPPSREATRSAVA